MMFSKFSNLPLIRAIRRKALLSCAAIAWLLFSITDAQAQFITRLDAQQVSQHCFRVTQDLNNQFGAVWFNNKLDLSRPLDLEFNIFMGSRDGDGADGIAFVMHDDPRGFNAIGEQGGGLGYGEHPSQAGTAFINRSVAIEFDTWSNNECSGTANDDPAFDHTTVVYNGNTCSPRFAPVRLKPASAPNRDNVEDNTCYTFRISWNPTTRMLQLYNGNSLIFQHQDNIIANVFTGTNQVYYGFTGSTGGSRNEQTVCIVGTNTVPVAQDDAATTNVNTAVLIDATANDSDSDGDDLTTIEIIQAPANGTATINANNQIVYTPRSGFVGSDVLRYKVCDANKAACYANCDDATVRITVNPLANYLPLVLTPQCSPFPQQFRRWKVSNTNNVAIPITYTIVSTGQTANLNVAASSEVYFVTPTVVTDAQNNVRIQWTDLDGSQKNAIAASVTTTCSCTLNVLATGANATCNASNGSISLTVTGGAGQYVYQWSNGATTKDISGLAPGNYGVSVMDVTAGCGGTATVVISAPTNCGGNSYAVDVEKTDVSCNGAANGTATVKVTGEFQTKCETPPASPVSCTSGCTSVVNDNRAITANNGQQVCLGTGNYSGTITLNGGTVVVCGSLGPNANVNVNGGGGRIYVLGAAVFQNLNLNPGSALINYGTIEFRSGISVTSNLTNHGTIKINGELNLNGQAQFYNTGTVEVTGSFNNNASTATNSGVMSVGGELRNNGSAVLKNNCRLSVTGRVYNNATIEQYGKFNISSELVLNGGSRILTYPNSELKAQSISGAGTIAGQGSFCSSVVSNGAIGSGLNVSGPVKVCASGNAGCLCDVTQPPCTYLWSTGATTPTVSNLAPGTYTVKVTCGANTVTKTVVISQPPVVAINVETGNDVKCYGQSNGSINLHVTGGTGPYTYQWSNGATTEDLTGLAAGSYIVKVTDNKGCVRYDTIDVRQPEPLNVSANVDGGAASIIVTGGVGPYTYQWPNGLTGPNQSGLVNGTYAVIVTDANGCTKTVDIVITEGADKCKDFLATLDVTNISCSGKTDGVAVLTVSNAVLPVTYQWSNGEGSSAVNNLAKGDYSVRVGDARGCGDTLTFTIHEPEVLVVTLDSAAISCFGKQDGRVTAVVTGGTVPYTYNWSNGSIASEILNAAAGTYSVTVADKSGCAASATASLREPQILSVSAASTKHVSCFDGTDGTAEIQVAGGTAPYVYSWSNGMTGKDLAVVKAGSYSLTVTDAGQCTATVNVQINQPDRLVLSLDASPTTCNGLNDGRATLSVAGGTAPYSFIWSNGTTSQNLDHAQPGEYTVQVTDAKGCTASGQISVGQPTGIAVTASVQGIACFGQNDGAIDVTVAGGLAPYTFRWNHGAVTEDVSGLAAGAYRLTVRDASGCEFTYDGVVVQPEQLVITTAVSGTNATATVTGGNAGYTYLWSNGVTTVTASLTPGVHTVRITDGKGCTATAVVTVGDDSTCDDFTATLVGTDVSCYHANNGSVNLSLVGGAGDYTYSWSNGAVTEDITNLAAGTYAVLVTDVATGCKATASVTVNEPAALAAALTVQNGTACQGPIGFDLSMSGGKAPYTFLWSNGATTEDVTNLAPGSYSVAIADANGCQITRTGAISGVPTLAASATVTGNDITLLIQGGSAPYTYAWNNGSTDRNLYDVVDGTYSVTITDAKQCQVAISAVVRYSAQCAGLTAAATSVFPSCKGAANGSINLSVHGGSGSVSYRWSNGATTEDLTGLSAGSYTVIVTDRQNTQCTTTATVVITEPATLLARLTASHVTCNGAPTGSILASVSGGTAPYTYQWNTGAAGTEISGLSAGVYSVAVTDAGGCTTSAQVQITQPAPLEVLVTASGKDALVTVRGGVAPYTYLWSNGATTQNLINAPAGTYTVTVTDASGCSVSKTVAIVAQVCDGFKAVLVPTQMSCGAGNDASIDLVLTGGSGHYQFLWNNGATTEDISGLAAGNYKVTVTDTDYDCRTQAEVTITAPQPLKIGGSNVVPVACYGGNNGTIQVTVSGGTAPYQYHWNNNSVAQNLSGLTPGTYTLTVTDARNCQAVASYVVSQPAQPFTAVATAVNAACVSNCNGAVSVAVSGGSAPFTYQWNNGASSQNLANVCAGNYSVVITDSKGCSVSKSVVVGGNDPCNTNQRLTGVAVCTANLAVTRGWRITNPNDADVTVFWDINGSQVNGTIIARGEADTYFETPTTAGGSVLHFYVNGQLQATVNGNNLVCNSCTTMSASVQPTNISCFGAQDGAATVTVTGAGGAVRYTWNTGASTAAITGLNAGTYTVTVEGGNGCVKNLSAAITEPARLAALANVTQASCTSATNGGSIILNVTGGTTPYTYSWSNGATTKDLLNVVSGTYQVTVRDAKNCTVQSSGIISAPAALTAAIANTVQPTCSGGLNGSVAVTVAGGKAPYTYAWSNGSTVKDLVNAGAGTYTLTVTDANGCAVTATATLSQPVAIGVTPSVSQITCAGTNNGSISLSVTGGVAPYTYTWNHGASTKDVNNLAAGTYHVTVRDSKGCVVSTEIIIEQVQSFTLASEVTQINCFGENVGGINLSVQGGKAPYTYVWSNGATTEDLANVAAGTYTVTVTDANQCSKTLQVVITQPAEFKLTIASANSASCSGGANGSIDLQVVGGRAPYTYLWNNGAATQDLANLSEGTYSVTVTDAKGCTKTQSATISGSPTLVASVSVTQATTCAGGQNGSVSVVATGGVSPYTYSWSNGATTPSLTGLAAGTYSVLVRDANNCTTSQSITLVQPASLSVTTVNTAVSCFGAASGVAQANVSGGVAPYSYTWSHGATTAAVSSLQAGTYTVVVKDANGCQQTATAIITQPAALSVSVGQPVNVSCNEGGNGMINASVSGGTAPFTYNWSNGATTQNLSGVAAGNYTVTVTDAKGCTATSNAVTVTQPSALAGTIAKTDITCYGANNGTATVSVSSGTAPYTYKWNTGATTASVSSLTPGAYSVVVRDVNNCIATLSVTIVEPAALTASLTPSPVTCAGSSTASIAAAVTGGTAPYAYRWSNGATTKDIDNVQAGIYSLTVTDSKGCIVTTPEVIIVTPVAMSVSLSATDASCGNPASGAVNATITGGTAPYRYAWSSGATTQNISKVTPGQYTITVTDAKGCTATATTTVRLTGSTFVITLLQSRTLSCDDASDAAINMQISGGKAPFTYVWSNGATTASLNGIAAGQYSLTVTDATGCSSTAATTIRKPGVSCDNNGCVLLSFTTTAVSCVGARDGAVVVNVVGGSGDYTYLWNTGSTSKNLIGVASRTYSVTVTDKSNPSCVRSGSVTVPDAQPLEIDITGARSTICGQNDEVLLTAEGSTGAYLWSTGETSASIAVSTPGTYWVKVSRGTCTATSDFVHIDRAPDELKIISSASAMCPGGQITLTSPYAANNTWSPGGQTSRSITVHAAGTYRLNVNFPGCYALDANITIQEKPADQCGEVNDPLCEQTPFPTIVVNEPCDKFATDLVLHNAQVQYQTYLENLRADFRERYVRQCLDVTETFNMEYTDKEHHRSLYYYDQAGNLVRTVPPEGVKLITDPAKLAKMKEDRANGERTLFTEHTLASTYVYNSLNQMVTQDMPDYKQMDIRSLTSGNSGLPSGLTVTGTDFLGQTGFLIGNDGTNGYIYRSDNGGQSWGNLSSVGVVNLADVMQIPNSTLAFATGDNGVFMKSANNGADWTIKPMPTLNNMFRVNFFSDLRGITIERDGTIWRTQDGGESLNWQQEVSLRNILVGSLKDVSFSGAAGIAVSESNSIGYVYRTTNEGATWSRVTTFKGVDQYSVNMHASLKGYSGGVDGSLLGTNDGGQSWQLLPTAQAITFRDLYFATDLHGFALDDSNTRLYKTANGGVNWQFSALPSGTYYALTGVNASTLYIAGSNGVTPVIKRSVDGGGSWLDVLTTGLPSEAIAAVYFRSETDGVALTNGGDIYTLVTDNTVVPAVTSWKLALDGNLRKLSFADGNNAFALDNASSIWRSSNGGSSWSQVANTVASGVTIKDISFPDVANGLAVGSNGMIFRTTNGGSTWVESSILSPIALNGVTLTGTTGYLAGIDGRVWKSTDAGASWKLQVTGNRSDLNTISTYNGTTVSGGGAAGHILRSADGGTSWAKQTSSDGKTFYDAVAFVNETLLAGESGIIAYDNGGRARTPNGPALRAISRNSFAAIAVGDNGQVTRVAGTSGWQDISSLKTEMLNDIHQVGSIAYAVGKNGTVIKLSSDGRWQLKPTGNVQTLNSVYFLDENAGVAVGNAGTLLRTANGGTDRFTRINSGTAAALRSVHFSSKGDLGIVVGQGGVILTSANGGQSWTTRSSGTTADLYAVYVVDRTTAYAVGTNGTILRGTNNGASWQTLTDAQGVNWLTSNGLPLGTLRDVFFRDYVTGYAVGDNGVILKTVTRGVSWEPEDNGGNNNTILDIAEREPGTVILSGTSSDVRIFNDETDQYGTRFFYDELGRMILVQNAKQFGKATPAYSYTLYDPLGQIAEVGEVATNEDPKILKNHKGQIEQQSFENWVTRGVRTEITRTWYDQAVIDVPGLVQDNLRGHVASATYQAIDGSSYDHAKHFSYDVHGNIKTLVIDFPALQNIAGNQRYKRIDYEYDLISGNLIEAKYQKDSPDEFRHRYDYDADNILKSVHTSRDGIIWDRDANYKYYAHGQLARVELGENNIQGNDYIYTAQGWLKGINSSLLDPQVDIGKDGANGNGFAKDQFGLSIGFYRGDYTPIGNEATDLHRVSNEKGLYNGNVSSMVSSVRKFMQGGQTQASQYEYDQLNRLKKVNSFALQSGGQLTAKNDYAEEYSYDANGNILTLKRNAAGAQANEQRTGMDNLRYVYENQQNGYKRNTNKLKAVVDDVSTPEGMDDIKPGQIFNANDPTQDNYQYDENGNLIADKQEGILKIEWLANGKVDKIEKTDGTVIDYDYDANGYRISKHVKTKSEDRKNFYIQDAAGNTLAIYELNGVSFKLLEFPLYGNERIGIRNEAIPLDAENVSGNYSFGTLGFKQFELKNHLGSVLAVVSDRKDNSGDAIVQNATDYYAFGMSMPGRTMSSGYRYGFNGWEKDPEAKGEGNEYATEFRQYDPRLGRYHSVDPQAMGLPSQSPYQHALNNPLFFVDTEGDFPKPSELLGDAGIKLPPIAAGLLDGLAEGSPIGMFGMAWDIATDGDFRQQMIDSFVTIAKDPVGFLGAMFSEYKDMIERIATGKATEEDIYKLGSEIGSTIAGALTGAAMNKIFGKVRAFQKMKVKVDPPGKAPTKVCGCFTEGTLILTSVGPKKIEEIEVGDSVWAYSDSLDRTELRDVKQTFERTYNEVYEIQIGDEKIKATHEHPFFIGGRWHKAEDVQAGDTLTVYDGKLAVVQSVRVLRGGFTVYNFIVDDFHTYYVSGDNILVHNGDGKACGIPVMKAKKAAAKTPAKAGAKPPVKGVKKGNVPHEQRDPVRRFKKKDIDEKYLENDGLCEYCSKKTPREDYRGDHRKAHGKGGRTDDANHAGSCKTCNFDKSDMDIGKKPGQYNPSNPLKKKK